MTDTAQALALTQQWLQKAVIGLNLCPFAKGVLVKGQIQYAVTQASTEGELLEALELEVNRLLSHDPLAHDTTLLIAPWMFADFLDFHAFLPFCDKLLRRMKLEGVLQIASFHPRYQFAGTLEDDITNFTNRAPFATLHLLREDSIARAVQAFEDPDAIYENNLKTMEALGYAGWNALGLSAPRGADRTGNGNGLNTLSLQVNPQGNAL